MGWGWEASALRRRRNRVLLKLFAAMLLVGVSFRLFYSDSDAFLPVSHPAEAQDGRKPFRDSPSTDKTNSSNTFISDIFLDLDDGAEDSQTGESPPVEKISASTTSVSGVTLINAVDDSRAESPPTEKSSVPNASILAAVVNGGAKTSQSGKCNLFTGEWISNPSGPAYSNESCPFIGPHQNCIKNGRPDTGYMYWRWKPHGCDVPSFDAEKFFSVMQNKSWALIGDSILFNHFTSLVCLLAKIEMPVELYHDEKFRSKRWHFPSHNITISVIFSPFLAKTVTPEGKDVSSSSKIQLHLDVLDQKWTSQYQSFDYIVISGGHWFLRSAVYLENNTIIGCHSCQAKNLTEIGPEVISRKVLQLLFRFFASSPHKPLVLYRTWAPSHFEHGEWYNGGICNRTVPFKEREIEGGYLDQLMRGIELEEFNKAATAAAAAKGTGNGSASLKLLDIYNLSLLRPDGHPGPYKNFHPFDKNKSVILQNDCLHWCLPGPIDSWNDLVMELVLSER